MGTQGASQHSFTFDAETLLHDGAAIAASGAGEVDSVAKVLDFGRVSPQGESFVAYTAGKLVVDVRAFEFGDADEFAQVIYQLSDDASENGVGFDGGDAVVNKAVMPFGAAGGLADSTADADSAIGRNVLGVDNEFKGDVFRFARLFVVVGGTTPSISPFAFLSTL